MTTLRGTSFYFWLVMYVCAVPAAAPAGAQFTTVINVPPNVSPSSIGSDTQLNVFDGGGLGYFRAGHPVTTHTNIEVNLYGGSVYEFVAYNGSSINISGGSVHFFHAKESSTVNISGGKFIWSTIHSGSTATISGGDFDHHHRFNSGSNVSMLASDFKLNGQPLAGLETIGDTINFTLPRHSVLTGTFASGEPFLFDNQDWCSECNDDTLNDVTLKVTAPPDITHYVINDPSELDFDAIRPGQTLNLNAGSVMADGFLAVGGQINLDGGTFGNSFDIAESVLNITGGSIGYGFDAFNASVVNMSGGVIGESGYNDSNGVHSGSVFTLTGGSTFGSFVAYPNSTAYLKGGQTERFRIAKNSTGHISGGNHEAYYASSDSTTIIYGTTFTLDGVDLTVGMSPDELVPMLERDILLEGSLADGTPFSSMLNTASSSYRFAEGANVYIVLVPEPATLGLIGIGGLAVLRRRVV